LSSEGSSRRSRCRRQARPTAGWPTGCRQQVTPFRDLRKAAERGQFAGLGPHTQRGQGLGTPPPAAARLDFGLRHVHGTPPTSRPHAILPSAIRLEPRGGVLTPFLPPNRARGTFPAGRHSRPLARHSRLFRDGRVRASRPAR